MATSASPHWLDQYGNATSHAWKTSTHDGHTRLYRPLGLVEYSFDSDGRYYEGRADLNVQLDLSIKSSLDKEQLRERIELAWALFQCEHPLAQSKALPYQSYMEESSVVMPQVYSVVDVPKDEGDAVENAKASLVFLEDHFEDVDAYDFWLHALRILDESWMQVKACRNASCSPSSYVQMAQATYVFSLSSATKSLTASPTTHGCVPSSTS
jgi:hypothetical protein